MPEYKVNAGMQHSRLQLLPFGIPQRSMLRIAPPIMTYFSKFFSNCNARQWKKQMGYTGRYTKKMAANRH